MSNTEQKNKTGEQRRGTTKRKKKSSNGALRAIGRVLLILLETVLLICLGLYSVMFVLAKGPSVTARNMFVSSVRETSAIKFLANIYFSPEEIEEIERVEETVEFAPTDTSLITIETGSTATENREGWTDVHGVFHPDEDSDGIIIEEVKGRG